MADWFGLGGKIAVVVGGGGGIGESVALGLSQQSAKVAIASRNLMKLEEKAKKMQAETGNEVVAPYHGQLVCCRVKPKSLKIPFLTRLVAIFDFIIFISRQLCWTGRKIIIYCDVSSKHRSSH